MTSGKRQCLRINMSNFDGDNRYAEYDSFEIDSANGTFKLLSHGTYSSDAGKSDIARC